MPTTATEKELCKIWEEIFCKKSIGITENYYSLGGDSLLATRMLTKIKARFLVKFSIADIMGRKTIREQAERIDELRKNDLVELEGNSYELKVDKVHEFEPFPLTDVQQAYWIGRSGTYDLGMVSTHCYFELEALDLNIQQLQQTWNDMIRYHGMIGEQLYYRQGNNKYYEMYSEYKFKILDLSNDLDENISANLEKIREEMSHQVIAADKWPLFDVRITILKNKNIRLHISFDNLIFDGWSMFHLLSEWTKRYRNEIQTFPELKISFRDYVLGIESLKKSETYERDRKYWLDRIPEFSLAPELPLAKKEGDITVQKFNRRSGYLSAEEWEEPKRFCTKV
ncbi:MAG: condensation domain-containing protein [Sellimonas intestinalis]